MSYRQSINKRKYSATPIVRVTLDDKGKEIEEIICICIGKKDDADKMSDKIIYMLNMRDESDAWLNKQIELSKNNNHTQIAPPDL